MELGIEVNVDAVELCRGRTLGDLKRSRNTLEFTETATNNRSTLYFPAEFVSSGI